MSKKFSGLQASTSIVAISLALLLGIGPVQAGAVAPVQAPATVITVEGTKVPQQLAQTPRVVDYLSAPVLGAADVRTFEDLQTLTPGLIFNTTNSVTATNARLWGVGTVGDNPGIEPSVGINVDGVFRPRTGVAVERLLDVDHVEVLKGPQGTLYGKNTSAGVIDVFTRAPTDEVRSTAEVSAGNYGYASEAVYLAGPLIRRRLLGSLSIDHDQRDGFYRVIAGRGPRGDGHDADVNSSAVRGQLLWRASDVTDVRLIADYSAERDSCCSAVQLKEGPTAVLINALVGGAGVAAPPDPVARTVYSNDSTAQRVRDGGLTLQAATSLPSLGGIKLLSITGARDWSANNANDGDFTAAAILARLPGQYRTDFKTLSEEVRAEHSGPHLHWMAGFYFQHENLAYDTAITYGSSYETYISLLVSRGANPAFVSLLTGLPVGKSYVAGAHSQDDFRHTSASSAVFSNATVRLTSRIDLELGVRYTEGTKDVTGAYGNSDNGIGCASAEDRFTTNAGVWAALPAASKPGVLGALCPFWTNPAYSGRTIAERHLSDNTSWSAKAVYHLQDAGVAYISASSGQKDGGYNLDRAVNGLTPAPSLYFRPETVLSYEAGVKLLVADGSASVSAAAFDETFRRFQLNTFLGMGYAVESIPQLTSRGVDLSAIWRTPLPELKIHAGVVYADTRYGQFGASDLVSPGDFPALSLLPGARASYAPKWSVSATATYGRNVPGGVVDLALTAKTSSSYSTGSDLIPAKLQPGFTVVNARASFTPVRSAWTVSIWVDNLTNRIYRQSVINAPLQGSGFQSTTQPGGNYYNAGLDTNTYDAFLGAPRMFGVTMKLRY